MKIYLEDGLTMQNGDKTVVAKIVIMLSIVAPLLAGCGGSEVELVDVYGTVTLDGSPMPGEGTLIFTPLKAAEGLPKLPGTARFDADGEYRAKSLKSEFGLVPGRYRVVVHCWEVEPRMGGPEPVSFIPTHYTIAALTKLEELVVPSGAGSHQWDIKLQSSE